MYTYVYYSNESARDASKGFTHVRHSLCGWNVSTHTNSTNPGNIWVLAWCVGHVVLQWRVEECRGVCLDKFCTCTHERDVPALSMCVCQPYFVMLDTGVHLHPISCQSGYLYSCLTHRQRAQGGGRASLTLPIGLPRGTLTALLSPPRLSERYRTMTGTWLKHDHWRPIIQQTLDNSRPERGGPCLQGRPTNLARIKKQLNLNNATFFGVS